MERTSSLLSLSSRSNSSSSSTSTNKRPVLPFSKSFSEKPRKPFPNPLTHCLYRRVLIWTVVSLALISFVFFGRHNSHASDASATRKESHGSSKQQAPEALVVVVGDKNAKNAVLNNDGYDDDEGAATYFDEQSEDGDFDVTKPGASPENMQKALQNLKRMTWLRFPHLNGFYHGLRTIVDKAHHQVEYPEQEGEVPFRGPVRLRNKLPKPVPYNPYNSSEPIKTCYLDSDNKIPAPSMYAYEGIPRHMPDPTIGSYDLLGMRDDVCFDRFGRYGPYGFGYRLLDGGTGVGLNTESAGSEEVWKTTGKINYAGMNWGDAQERCVDRNAERLRQVDSDTDELEDETPAKKGRMAVVIRMYTGFQWTYLAVLNFRALINELSLKSGGEYTVHFLMHVRDNNLPIWADDGTVQQVLDQNVPPEFHSMVTLWSEAQMALFYPGNFGSTIHNPSGQHIHGVYRSAHMPLQVFALNHPEYEHVWNWEMDIRFLGNYYELFDRLGKWADQQPRQQIWERSARYFIPSYHGTWENFTESVAEDTRKSGRQSIFGPLNFEGKATMRHELHGQSVVPKDCENSNSRETCGVGEKADLITLNPLFDIEESGWVFQNDATGYPSSPPRRCAIITAGRLSRRLLMAMHEEVWKHHHSMFSEMFPPSMALHHGFKAAFAPHPIYLDRAWDPQGSTVDAAFNGGRDHSTSGRGSPFDLQNEHNHKGTSWYYNSEFAGMVWRRWLGYAQLDGRGRFGGQIGKGQLRGGKEQEEAKGSTGRMCMRSMLLHPIKHEDPSE